MTSFRVQKNNNQNSANLMHYAVTGALVGYASKYAIPVTERERKQFDFSEAMRNANKNLDKELDSFVRAVQEDATSSPPNQASKIFSENFDAAKKPSSIFKTDAYKKADDEVKIGVQTLVEQYHTIKSNGKQLIKTGMDNMVKSFRSGGGRAVLGMFAGITAAVALNALNNECEKTKRQEKLEQQKKEILEQQDSPNMMLLLEA